MQTEPNLEVVVVLNDASSAVEDSVDACAARDERIHKVRSGPVSASEARNHGVAAARAPVLYFLDDDVEVPPGGVAAVLDVYAAYPDASIVGGPNLTHPEDPDFAQLTGEILASAWGTGVARGRYTKLSPHAAHERHLILCNLAIRRSVFDGGVRFPLHFGGEENVVMGDADARGHELRYSPDVWVHHHRRASLRHYALQMVRYGRGRAIALRSAPRTFHAAYFVPVLLLLYLLTLPLSAALTRLAWAPIFVYALGSVVAAAVIVVRRRRLSWLFALPPLFLVTHVAYAAGLLNTLVRGPRMPARATARRPMTSEN